jgi:hypothetical protein
MDSKHDANELALLYNEITEICNLNNTSVADAREHILSILRDGIDARQVCNEFPATDSPDMYTRIAKVFLHLTKAHTDKAKDVLLDIVITEHGIESLMTRIVTDARKAAASDDVEEVKKTIHSIIAAIEDGHKSKILNTISLYMDSICELPLWSTIDAVLAVYPADRSIDTATFFRDILDLHPLVDRQSKLLEEDLERVTVTDEERWNARSTIGRAVAATRHFDSTHDFENVLVDGGKIDYARWISESKNTRASI